MDFHRGNPGEVGGSDGNWSSTPRLVPPDNMTRTDQPLLQWAFQGDQIQTVWDWLACLQRDGDLDEWFPEGRR